MAHTVLLLPVGTPSVELPNIDRSVGATSGSNRPDDVMLVQALLRLFFYEVAQVAARQNKPPAGFTGIAVDGKCGPSTQEHLRQFKVVMRKAGMPTLADGKVDPVPKFWTDAYAATPHRKDYYVLDVLVSHCKKFCITDGRLDLFYFKSRTTGIPLELRNALERVSVVT